VLYGRGAFTDNDQKCMLNNILLTKSLIKF